MTAVWHAENDGATEKEVQVFLYGLVRLLQPEYVVEIGTYQGHGASAIGNALKDNEHGQLDTLDISEGEHSRALLRCGGLPVNLLTMDARRFIPKQKVDLLFLDGGEDRFGDYLYFWPHLNRPAWIVIHDAKRYHPALFMGGLRIDISRGLALWEIR